MDRRDFLLLSAATTAGFANAQITGINDAINKAGRQRMLSQRMGKAWLALLSQTVSEYIDIKGVLDNSVSLFERQLIDLASYAPNSDLRETYDKLRLAWDEYRAALIVQPASQPQAGGVLQLDGKVLRLAQQGTLQYEAVTGKPLSKLVNMAGRQRMLSQRMAKYFFAASMDLQADTAKKEIKSARTEFIAAMDILAKAPEATYAIKDSLSLVQGQWIFFDFALQRLDRGKVGRRQLTELFVSSETILVEMERVTELFANLKT
jgi:Type IV pili methyl-accepting chemotaxis transducer N-term